MSSNTFPLEHHKHNKWLVNINNKNLNEEFDPTKSVVYAKLCYSAFQFWDCITYLNETCVVSLVIVLKSKDVL